MKLGARGERWVQGCEGQRGLVLVFGMGGSGIPSSHNIELRTARKRLDWI